MWHLELGNPPNIKTIPASSPNLQLHIVLFLSLQVQGKVWNQRVWVCKYKSPKSLPNFKKWGRFHQNTHQWPTYFYTVIVFKQVSIRNMLGACNLDELHKEYCFGKNEQNNFELNIIIRIIWRYFLKVNTLWALLHVKREGHLLNALKYIANPLLTP